MAQNPSTPVFRPLLPGPSSTSTLREREQPPGDETPCTPRRVTVTAACESCRQRKVKCDGGRPCCTACSRAGRECVYSTEPSESRGAALKRKYVDIEDRLSEHEELYQQLKNRPLPDAKELLDRIRAGGELPSILQYMRQGDLLLEARLSPQQARLATHCTPSSAPRALQDLVDTCKRTVSPTVANPEPLSDFSSPLMTSPATALRLEHVRDAPYHAAQIVDPRLGRVRAAVWTGVTGDDELVARLLGTYFQWEFPLNPFFQKDLFLDDLVSGQGRFCSSLLVNAILATAAHGLAEDTERAQFWAPGSLAYAFMAETKRLWETEGDSCQLTTIQTASILSFRHTADGTDKLGLAYLRRAATMAEGIGLFTEEESPDTNTGLARTVTAWGLFNWQSMCCFYMHIRPVVARPPATPLPSPPLAPTVIGELYIRYPPSQTLVPVFLSQCFCAFAKLRTLMTEIMLAQDPYTSRQNSLPLQEALKFREELLAWYKSLPMELQAHNVILPHHLHVHTGYHIVLANLFEPFLGGGIEFEASRDGKDDVGTMAAASQVQLESLVRLYNNQHDFSGPDVFLLFSFLQLGSAALRNLAAASPAPEDLGMLCLCAKGLRDQGRNNYLGILIFRALSQSIKRDDAHIRREISSIQAEIPARLMTSEHVHSEWPVYKWINMYQGS